VEVVVPAPVKPPAAIRVLPTLVPPGKERSWFSVGSLPHEFVAGV
jgi:hypothetical protein